MCILQTYRIFQENLKNETDFVSFLPTISLRFLLMSLWFSVSTLHKDKRMLNQQHIAMVSFNWKKTSVCVICLQTLGEQTGKNQEKVFSTVRRKDEFTESAYYVLPLDCSRVLPSLPFGGRFPLEGGFQNHSLEYKCNLQQNVSMRIFKALYFLPSGRLHTTGETIADGGEMEMFCAVSESVWLLCLKLLQ